MVTEVKVTLSPSAYRNDATHWQGLDMAASMEKLRHHVAHTAASLWPEAEIDVVVADYGAEISIETDAPDPDRVADLELFIEEFSCASPWQWLVPQDPSHEPTCLIVVRCLSCNEQHSLTVPTAGWVRWMQGYLIQDALPSLNPDQRELLISNTCPACFSAMFEQDDNSDDTDDKN